MKASIIGFFAYAYPETKMKERVDNAVKALKSKGVEVNFCGYVTDHDETSQFLAKEKLDKSAFDSDCIVLVVSAWVESPPIIRVLSNHMHVPLLLWSVAGYRTDAGLISPAGAAGATGLNFALKVFGAKHISIYDVVDKDIRVDEAAAFIKFASALKRLRNTRVAAIGYADMNLYSLKYDGVLIKKYTGIHVDNLDFYDLYKYMEEVQDSQVKDFIKDFKSKVTFKIEATETDLNILAKSYTAINRLIEEKDYKAITLKCVLGMSKWMNFSPCMLESLIADKVDTICECDVHGMINQLIIRELTGTKAVFMEFYEFYEKSILTGACGFSPFSLCADKCITAMGHEWGQAGGIMNISELKGGKITFTKIYTVNGQMHMHCFRGTAKSAEKWQEDGWDGKGPKLPSLEISIEGDMEEFQEYVEGQHYIVSYGDFYKSLERFCKFTGIRFNEHKSIDFSYK
jgi:L-fucose isomerase-like protein